MSSSSVLRYFTLVITCLTIVTVLILLSLTKQSPDVQVVAEQVVITFRKPSPQKRHPNATSFLWYDVFLRAEDSTVIFIGPDSVDNNLLTLETATYTVDGIPMKPVFVHNTGHVYVAPGPTWSYVLRLVHPTSSNQRLFRRRKSVTVQVTLADNTVIILRDLRKTEIPLAGMQNGVSFLWTNDSELLPPWIGYYASQGFDTFILYNNNPEDVSNLNIKYLTSMLTVTTTINIIFWDWPFSYWSPEAGQVTSQNHALYYYGSLRWLVFCDNDEYLVPRSTDQILPLLDSVAADRAGVCIESVWFGCNGDIRNAWNRTNYLELMIRRKVTSEGHNQRTKIVVRPAQTTLVTVHIIKFANQPIILLSPADAWFHHYSNARKLGRACFPEHDAVEDKRLLQLWNPFVY